MIQWLRDLFEPKAKLKRKLARARRRLAQANEALAELHARAEDLDGQLRVTTLERDQWQRKYEALDVAVESQVIKYRCGCKILEKVAAHRPDGTPYCEAHQVGIAEEVLCPI